MSKPWCNVFRTSDLLTVNDEDSLKSSESEESLMRSDSEDWIGGLGTGVTSNYERTYRSYCIRRRPESGVMPHSTALDNHQLLFRHSLHVYIHWSNCSLDKNG